MGFFSKTKEYVKSARSKHEARTEKRYRSIEAKTKIRDKRNKILGASERSKARSAKIRKASVKRRFGGFIKAAKGVKRRSTKRRSGGASRIVRKVRANTKEISSSPFAPEKWK